MPACRYCQSNLSTVFVDLGQTPLSNSYIKKDDLDTPELSYPLIVYVCDSCFLVQLPEFETPENIFGHYLYLSSFSKSWLDHAKNYVELITKKFNLNSNNLVIEVASNDGYLLQFFKEKNIPVLGIEPAANVAEIARKKGINTLTNFFGKNFASQLNKSGKLADLIIGNNVLAHVPDLNDFVQGLKIILKNTGVITMEFPHLLQLIDKNQFDTIYHEHFSYLSLSVVKKVFAHHGLKIFDVDTLSTHGGSIRIYATHNENDLFKISQRIQDMLDDENEFGITKIESYKKFSNNILNIKNDLLNFLKSVKENGQSVVCYGAAAKGNTLLNYCKINSSLIDYVVDKNEYKQGLFLPGSHIPIKSPEEIFKTKPDFVFILPWNLKDEIVNQMAQINQWGGKFIVAIPKVQTL